MLTLGLSLVLDRTLCLDPILLQNPTLLLDLTPPLDQMLVLDPTLALTIIAAVCLAVVLVALALSHISVWCYGRAFVVRYCCII
jgi:hypothetical protein